MFFWPNTDVSEELAENGGKVFLRRANIHSQNYTVFNLKRSQFQYSPAPAKISKIVRVKIRTEYTSKLLMFQQAITLEQYIE
jgi:hypothetical protein